MIFFINMAVNDGSLRNLLSPTVKFEDNMELNVSM